MINGLSKKHLNHSFTGDESVEKNRDMLIRFLKGYLEGIYFMTGDKEESLKAFAKYLKNSDPAVNSFLYDDITSRVARDLRPTRNRSASCSI